MLARTLLLLLLLLLEATVTELWAQPYPIPPTCYSKVLAMGKEITQGAAQIKTDHDTHRCTAHLPDLYIDVHNACVMSSMNSYLSLLDGLRERRCAYTRKVQSLRAVIRQLYIIMSQKCHGDLVFTRDNCEALQHRG
ncbi:cytokine-like protein 1 [Sinocyclocheilus rhinocerous]|uniref:Cytokine-like protein 1 n=1 Tax=Sinocyclocheilus rhinocerous TaxID=307959 RepID=A0A673GVE4_9TELE|nr:PREDICTED: cytokine-like protein 1 [Sinocyclocheilus rhinocerous]